MPLVLSNDYNTTTLNSIFRSCILKAHVKHLRACAEYFILINYIITVVHRSLYSLTERVGDTSRLILSDAIERVYV